MLEDQLSDPKIPNFVDMEGSEWNPGVFHLREKVIPGVYAFVLDGIILLTGKSTNLLATCHYHRSNPWFRLHFKYKQPTFYWKESEFPDHDIYRLNQIYKPMIHITNRYKHLPNRLYRGKRRMKRRKGWNGHRSDGFGS